ncbi:MAG: hypothetical protein ABSG60_01050 [Terracidiphilus sp.]|jgi:hypothetical protein
MSQLAAPCSEDRFRAPGAIFWTAFLVRVAYITLAHTYRIPAYNHHFEFAWETGRVAASVAGGHGYSSPFSGDTGPTAWMVPGFTLLLAGVFKVFGIYTPLSAWIIQTIDSLFQALTAPLVYEMGARLVGRRNGLWAAWIWALYPGIMQYGVKWIWETSLSTMLFAAVLVLGMRMRGIGAGAPETHRARDWALFGLLWGAISMCNPTLLLMAPIQGVWILAGLPQRKNLLKGAALALLAAAISGVVATPWVVRNWMVFHAFIPTRDNFGAEAAMAWAPESEGFPWGATVPTLEAAPEHKLYAQMGELAYVKMRGDLAWKWARAYPVHFWKLVALRFYMFWASVPHTTGPVWVEVVRSSGHCLSSIAGILGVLLALRRRLPAAGLFACAVVLLPAIYYFISAGSRFRNPLEPFFCVLIVFLFQQAERRWGFTLPGLQRMWPMRPGCTVVSAN